MSVLNTLINIINTHPKYSKLGSFELVTDQDMIEKCLGYTTNSGDIVIGYDYGDDELPVNDVNPFVDWLYKERSGAWGQINRLMKEQGYHIADDQDGSGGGLYYGVTLFKKGQ